MLRSMLQQITEEFW